MRCLPPCPQIPPAPSPLPPDTLYLMHILTLFAPHFPCPSPHTHSLRELVEEVRALPPPEPPAPFIKPDLSSLPPVEPLGSLSTLAAKRFRVSRAYDCTAAVLLSCCPQYGPLHVSGVPWHLLWTLH